MKTLGDLRAAVKRFVWNNTNAADTFQGSQTETFEDTIDAAFLTAANNARKYAEKNASFSALEVTVPAFFPKGMGINLERLYATDADFDVSVATNALNSDDTRIVYNEAGYTAINGTYRKLGVLLDGTVVWTGVGSSVVLTDGVLSGSGMIFAQRDVSGFVWYLEDNSDWELHSPSVLLVSQPLQLTRDVEATPYHVTTWYDVVNSDMLTLTPTVSFPKSVIYRYDGNGILYIGILDLADFWGDANFRDLKSFEIAKRVDGPDVPEFLAKEHTVWDYLQILVRNSKNYMVYRIGYKNPEIKRPTGWVEVDADVGPGYFCEWFKLNNITALNYVSEDGGKYPIDLTTKQSEHQRVMDLVRSGCNLKAVLEGKILSLNLTASEDIPVEISGYRWLKDYNDDSDTDFLLEDGFDFMQWQTILELNYIVQIYITRNEGSLPPPEKARNEAWNSLMVNDSFANSSFYLHA